MGVHVFPILTLLPPSSPSHLSGSSQCTSPEHPVSSIEPGLVIYFTYDNIHVSMLFSQITPPLPSPTESKSLFFISVSLLLSCIQGHCYHLSKFHVYTLIGRDSGWTLGVGVGQGGLACCSSWDRKELDTTERLNWTEQRKKFSGVL